MPRIYCAGPLFNEPEREEMTRIAGVLERAGHTTFLPHRDGLEFAKLLPALREAGMDSQAADKTLQRAIFSLDVYELLNQSDAVVANLNGRVPDEGTVVEAALAWLSGKPIVLYKADARSSLAGSDNPMLLGLGDFELIDAIDALPEAMARTISRPAPGRISETLAFGAGIAQLRRGSAAIAALAASLMRPPA